MAYSAEDQALIDAVNLLGEYAEQHLPAGYQVVLSFSAEEASIDVFRPDGDELEFQPYGDIAGFRQACMDATEDDAAEKRRQYGSRF